MITKTKKQEILNYLKTKEEKINISNIIDKANKSESSNILTHSNFLDLNEIQMMSRILDNGEINYKVYFPNVFCEKAVMFFIPEFLNEDEINFNEYISCVKIDCKNYRKLSHKDFMGSIYSLGIKREVLGDIFVSDGIGYVYVLKNMAEFIENDLLKVANQTAICTILDLDSEESKNLKVDYIEKIYIVPSFRVDALLSEVYSLSRSESKQKIVSGDMYINAKEVINPAENYKEGDIISFKRCGKLKVGKLVRKTKSENLCINIFKYN